jgi:thioredoxin 1
MNTTQSKASFRFVAEVEFELQVLRASKPVLVLFWTAWSRPCQVIDSVLAEVAARCADNVEILKVNADDNPELSFCYDIESVPTLLFFRDGRLEARLVGTASSEAILAKLQAVSQAVPARS